jgi:dTDP-4-dehydrorhamnose reductase
LDLYGRTKLLGETNAENCLTIRTSMIGRELNSSHGLVEWFIAQRDKKVKGFKRAIFSGFPTVELAGIIGNIIEHHPQLQGIWHVAADPINKFNLLMLLRRYFHLNIEVEPDENFACDRSLDGGRFRRATGFEPRPWPEMIERMAQDKTPYEEIRRIDAS